MFWDGKEKTLGTRLTSVRLIKANFPYSIQQCWDTTTDEGILFCSMKVYGFGRLLEERLCELHNRISFSRISKFIHERSSGMASARNPKPEVLISPTWLGLAHHWTILSYVNFEHRLRQSMAKQIGTNNRNASDWSTIKCATRGISSGRSKRQLIP